MRLAMCALALCAVAGCASKLKHELNAGAPPSYIDAYAKEEGISVDEARQRLVEMRRSPTTNPGIANSQMPQQRVRGVASPKAPTPW